MSNPLCACGCGKEVKKAHHTYVRGHQRLGMTKQHIAELKAAKSNETQVQVVNPSYIIPKNISEPDKCVDQMRNAIISIGNERIDPATRIALKKEGILGVHVYTSHLEAMLRNMFVSAVKGKAWAVAIILERLEGRVPININLDVGNKNLSDEDIEKEIRRLEGVINSTANREKKSILQEIKEKNQEEENNE